MTKYPLEIFNVQESNAGGSDQSLALQLGTPCRIIWVQYAIQLGIVAIATQSFGGYFELMRKSTYVPLGTAGQPQNSDVICQAVLKTYSVNTTVQYPTISDNGIFHLGVDVAKGEKLYLNTYVYGGNHSFLVGLTIGFTRG